MAPCTANYLHTLIFPFNIWDQKIPNKWFFDQYGQFNSLPCIPTFPPKMSRKFFTYVKFDFQSNAAGTACVAMKPFSVANDYPASNSLSAAIAFSTPSYTGTGRMPILDTSGVSDTGVTWINMVSDYSMADLVYDQPSNSGIQMRVVAAGLRVSCTGALLALSGIQHICQTPVHDSLTMQDVTQLSYQASYFSEENRREWTTLCYAPVQEQEYAFLADPVVNAQGTGIAPFSIARHHMGALITGAGASTPFRGEAIVYWEAVGEIVRDKTRSENDPIGVATVSQTVMPETNKMMAEKPGVLEKVAQFASDAISTVKPIAETVIPIAKMLI